MEQRRVPEGRGTETQQAGDLPVMQMTVDAAPVPTVGVDTRANAASILFNEMPRQSAPTGFNSAFGGNTLGNRNILVITPHSNQEVLGAVEHLKTGEAVIVTLDGIAVADAQRRIDFLSGVVCALNGIIKPLDTNKYILTPCGVGIKN